MSDADDVRASANFWRSASAWKLARKGADLVGCSQQEFIELAVRTFADIAIDGKPPVRLSLYLRVVEARNAKQSIADIQKAVKAAREADDKADDERRQKRRAEIAKRAEKPRCKPLTHNPFAKLLTETKS